MTTTVTTHSTSGHVSMMGNTVTTGTSCDSAIMGPQVSTSSVSSMSGLLNSRNLVQDEKLVVATLATLDSGNPSNLIKQDLKWIIQSRRKAEGKAELQVEFKKPVKDELTSEELVKRARRRELNRLAARRSREKGQKRKDMLVEEIRKLQSQNSELINLLGGLTEQRNNIIDTLRQHMKQCSDYQATQNAAVGMSQRVLEMLGFPSSSSLPHDIPGVSGLYISTEDLSPTTSQSLSPSIIIKEERFSYSSSPSSPVIVGLSGKPLIAAEPLRPVKAMIKVEDSPPLLSPCVFHPSSSPSATFSKSAISKISPFENSLLLEPQLNLAKRRSSTQILEPPPPPSSVESESSYESEYPQYKHKLMKHRKQSTFSSDFTKPSSLGVRYNRVANSANLNLFISADVGGRIDNLDRPLDLAVKKRSSSVCIDKEEDTRSTDTWPLSGSCMGLAGRGIERRWSVDDHHSISQPLNLSRESFDEDISLSSSSSNLPAPSGSQYSGYIVEPYS
ncbi:uncharacterized protein LOC131932354 [Physella acuta]|uniref:uncharacterized protein LOC131932354 n=1 Tax=Physella acuta TaxID=109671 RepID=UPI0027DC434C|nr:uncharacterized protein LOC131932354 [Physella acuta]